MKDDTFLTREQKKELKKERARKRESVIAGVFVVLLFGGYALWSLGFGVYGLFMADHMDLSELGSGVKMYAIYEGDFAAVSDLSDGGKVQFCGEMEHTICLIPYAHEYFYFITIDSQQKVVPVRAGKHWGEGLGVNSGVSSILIQGQIRRMNHYEMKNRLIQIAENKIESFEDYQLETDYYIDLTSTKMNVLHVIVGIGLLVVILGIAIYAKRRKNEKSDSVIENVLLIMYGVLFFVIGGLMIYVISVG